jgi:hypothetical protein
LLQRSGRVLCVLVGLALSACLRAGPGAELYRQAAGWLEAQAPPNAAVGVPAGAAGYFATQPVVALSENDDALAMLARLADSRPAYVVAVNSVVWDGVRAQPWFTRRYRSVASWSSAYASLSPLTLYAYRPTPFDRGQLVELAASFAGEDGGGDVVLLRAYRNTSAHLTPGADHRLTLYWDDVPGRAYRALTTEVRIVDPGTGRVWSRVERRLDEGAAGLPGYRLASRYVLALPEDLPQGAYTITVTVRRQNGAALLVAVDGQQLPSLPLVAVAHPPDVSRTPVVADYEAGAAFGAAAEIALVGYDAPAWALPGEPVRVALVWAAQAAVTQDLKVFVHLLDREDRLVAQSDGRPVFGFYPTTQWQPGDYVRDEHLVTLPGDLPPGHYRVVVGLYAPDTGERVAAALSGALLPDDRVLLHDLRVW